MPPFDIPHSTKVMFESPKAGLYLNGTRRRDRQMVIFDARSPSRRSAVRSTVGLSRTMSRCSCDLHVMSWLSRLSVSCQLAYRMWSFSTRSQMELPPQASRPSSRTTRLGGVMLLHAINGSETTRSRVELDSVKFSRSQEERATSLQLCGNTSTSTTSIARKYSTHF